MTTKKLPDSGTATDPRFFGASLLLAATLAAAGGVWPDIAMAQPARGVASAGTTAAVGNHDDVLTVELAHGDTLIRIGKALLEQPADWRKVAEFNGLTGRQLRFLRVGSSLRIPRELLRSQPSQATISLASGNSTANGRPAKVGDSIGESAVLNTGADGVLEIRLADGSSLRLTPNSQMRLERLRRYHREDIVEARTLLEKGRVEAQAGPQRQKPLQIRTPFATAAVRGTQFRVGSSAEVVTAEVLEGGVQWGAPEGAATRNVAVSAGFGSAGSREGVKPPERLLPAPDLAGWPTSVQTAVIGLDFPAVDRARAFRVQLSADAGFATLLDERVIDRPRLDYPTERDGSLFVRIRPIAASAVEGLDRVARIEVRARPFAPTPRTAPNSGVLFETAQAISWSPAEQASAYRLQVAEDESFSRILSEQQVAATSAQITLADASQARSTRFWRVAGVNATGGYLGPFSQPQKLSYYAPPAPPRLEASEVERALLGWSARPGERYRLEIADNPLFERATRQDLAQTRFELTNTRPGRYFARLAALTDDGVTTPYSSALEFVVRSGIRTGSGEYLESGTGTRIQGQFD